MVWVSDNILLKHLDTKLCKMYLLGLCALKVTRAIECHDRKLIEYPIIFLELVNDRDTSCYPMKLFNI